MSIPAGWYDDGSGAQRWWDGTNWTEHVGEQAAPAAPTAPVAPAAPAATYPAGYPAQAVPTNGMAIAALVLGLVGTGIIAVIFGHISLAQIKRQPAQQGKGMAIAGLILGYLVIAVWVIVIGIWLLAFASWQAQLLTIR